MITVLLVTQDDQLRKHIEGFVRDASVFVAPDAAEALRQMRRVDIDLVMWTAGDGYGVQTSLERIREVAPSCVTVAIADGDDDGLAADFVLPLRHTARQLQTVVGQALEKQRLIREVASLRAHPAQASLGNGTTGESALPTRARLPREFTRILAAGSDLPRTLEIFVDAVSELLRPARLALLLPDADRTAYRVRVHRGLSPQIADSVRLPEDRGLCHWLTVEGRPARIGDIADAQVARELAVLQGTMALPFLARGELVAVLVVGPPIVRSAYVAHEVETLFDLATHFASVIQSIDLNHRLQRASEFNAQILEHMSSGVVTIGADERITIMNRRAAEILGVDSQATVGHDLRTLPSPLGDMLYETLATGRARPRAEIRLALKSLWLEISAYPVRGEDTTGAVLVFEDITAQKELAAQKRQAEQFDLLAGVVARVADEIKNPLVSINTFMELINERFDDPDFRQQFSSVVGRDVRRLVQVLEKLTGLVTQAELNFTTVDVHTIVDEAVAAVQVADDSTRTPIDVRVTRDLTPLRVRVDATQLRKALAYLMWYLGYHSGEDAAVSVSIGLQTEDDGPDDVRVVIASRTASVNPLDFERLFDPVRMVQENLIDIGPAVSQRIVEALGGRLALRHGRNDISFVMRLPAAG